MQLYRPSFMKFASLIALACIYLGPDPDQCLCECVCMWCGGRGGGGGGRGGGVWRSVGLSRIWAEQDGEGLRLLEVEGWEVYRLKRGKAYVAGIGPGDHGVE